MYQHRSVNGNEKILKMDTASSNKQSFTVGVGPFGYHFTTDHRDLLTRVASIAV